MTKKTLKRGTATLEHSVFVDAFGFPKDSFIISFQNDGHIINYPFRAPIRANSYTKDTPIKFSEDYTDEEYENMFDEQLAKII